MWLNYYQYSWPSTRLWGFAKLLRVKNQKGINFFLQGNSSKLSLWRNRLCSWVRLGVVVILLPRLIVQVCSLLLLLASLSYLDIIFHHSWYWSCEAADAAAILQWHMHMVCCIVPRTATTSFWHGCVGQPGYHMGLQQVATSFPSSTPSMDEWAHWSSWTMGHCHFWVYGIFSSSTQIAGKGFDHCRALSMHDFDFMWLQRLLRWTLKPSVQKQRWNTYSSWWMSMNCMIIPWGPTTLIWSSWWQRSLRRSLQHCLFYCIFLFTSNPLQSMFPVLWPSQREHVWQICNISNIGQSMLCFPIETMFQHAFPRTTITTRQASPLLHCVFSTALWNLSGLWWGRGNGELVSLKSRAKVGLWWGMWSWRE